MIYAKKFLHPKKRSGVKKAIESYREKQLSEIKRSRRTVQKHIYELTKLRKVYRVKRWKFVYFGVVR